MPARQMRRGPVSAVVAGNLRTRRTALDLSQRALAHRLTELGWPTIESQISKMEGAGIVADAPLARRIDVDDLAFLALALECSPIDLLGADETAATRHAWIAGYAAALDNLRRKPWLDTPKSDG